MSCPGVTALAMGQHPTPLTSPNLQSWGWRGAPKELRSNPAPRRALSSEVLFQARPSAWGSAEHHPTWLGLIPPLGSAAAQTLFPPRSQSTHQAENLFLGAVCAQKSLVVPPGEKPTGGAIRGGWSSQLPARLCPAPSCARARAAQPRRSRSGCRPQPLSLSV